MIHKTSRISEVMTLEGALAHDSFHFDPVVCALGESPTVITGNLILFNVQVVSIFECSANTGADHRVDDVFVTTST